MANSVDPRKHALECMRMMADCMQLAGDVRNPAMQRYFLRQAGHWTALAERGPDATAPADRATKRA